MRGRLALLLLVGMSVVTACGGGEEESAPAKTAAPAPKADETVTFEVAEENRSGKSGTATLKGGDGGFTVTLELKRPRGYNLAHIHTVTCEKYRALTNFDEQFATVSAPLTDLEEGKSRSRVDTALSEYRPGYSINVHSTKGGFPVVACGDIPSG
jgi:hypothetical protein